MGRVVFIYNIISAKGIFFVLSGLDVPVLLE